MKLKSAKIRKFKRFVDLSIQDLPSDAKLIVLLGPNGCGKSSLFDAFNLQLKLNRFYVVRDEWNKYYWRQSLDAAEKRGSIILEFHGGEPTSDEDLKKSLYIRSAYRHDPSFLDSTIRQQPDVLDRIRNKEAVHRLIDTDRTVQNNYQRIVWRLLSQVTTPNLTTDDIMEDTIGDLQRSMKRVFGDICLDKIVAPQDTGTFTFTKGASENFLYENMSAGEKAAFDLLLDIVVSRTAFDNSIYCIDEPEAHLNTRLQGKLLKELYRLIPDNCQLWLATHSIGMVRAAQEIRAEHEEYVVFLDMGFGPDGAPRDYDYTQTIKPADPNHEFWRRHYAVALDDMVELLAPDCIVLCEGTTDGDNPSLDESCYNKIFAKEFPQTRFVSVGSATKVEKRMGDLLPILKQISRGMRIIRFRDRDDLTQEEITNKRAEDVFVMSGYRNIESLLLSDNMLLRLCNEADKPDRLEAIKAARDKQLATNAGKHAANDLKPTAQAVHQAVKKELKLTHPGETKHAFMRDLLAPLVTADTPEYQQLRSDIFHL